ncbi:CAP domain-containing protein [Paraburkholderia aromaticivorans]|uniref:CAP domain-containing protein n=1 Tax=Paraburkholderia aromaticivorans TaxID=2026199 RepID=UPI0038B84E4E
MTIKSTFTLTSAVVAAAILVAACGGGGGGGSSPAAGTPASAPGSASAPSSASSPVTGTQPTPQYAANSATLAMFNQVNAYRQQCGFPAVQQNTVLDQAAQAHAMWEGLNNTVADNETAGQQGFTGVTYLDRAAHFGFPTTNAIGGGVSAAHWTAAALTETQYGQLLVNQWFTGVYHAPVVLTPVTKIGIGEYETSLSGFPAAWGSATLEDTSIQQLTTGAPLTFPCQGVTGLPPKAHTETPTPPNTSGPWGTPVIVMGNVTDTIVLTSGTMTDPSGNVINLQLLYSANDPNKELQPYEAVAYPTTPLAENTTYTVNVSGTQNGKPFTKPPFPFTTGTINW